MTREFLGGFELLVLTTLMGLDAEQSYGVPIASAIEETSGRTVSIGSVYTTLERLEKKGLVRSALGEATAVRGGRAKTYFRVTAKGVHELKAAQRTLTKLWGRAPRLQGGMS